MQADGIPRCDLLNEQGKAPRSHSSNLFATSLQPPSFQTLPIVGTTEHVLPKLLPNISLAAQTLLSNLALRFMKKRVLYRMDSHEQKALKTPAFLDMIRLFFHNALDWVCLERLNQLRASTLGCTLGKC